MVGIRLGKGIITAENCSSEGYLVYLDIRLSKIMILGVIVWNFNEIGPHRKHFNETIDPGEEIPSNIVNHIRNS